jgi:hypothetical protein
MRAEIRLVGDGVPAQGSKKRCQQQRPKRPAVGRQLVLEVCVAAERLELAVLHPGRAYGFIRQALDVLEQVQPDHQPGRQAGPADMLDESGAIERIEPVPVGPCRQSQQFMPGGRGLLLGSRGT